MAKNLTPWTSNDLNYRILANNNWLEIKIRITYVTS